MNLMLKFIYMKEGAGASFMGWGSQSYLDGTSKALSELHFANEESYRSQGINIHCNSDVIKLNTEEKYVVVKHQLVKKTIIW